MKTAPMITCETCDTSLEDGELNAVKLRAWMRDHLHGETSAKAIRARNPRKSPSKAVPGPVVYTLHDHAPEIAKLKKVIADGETFVVEARETSCDLRMSMYATTTSQDQAPIKAELDALNQKLKATHSAITLARIRLYGQGVIVGLQKRVEQIDKLRPTTIKLTGAPAAVVSHETTQPDRPSLFVGLAQPATVKSFAPADGDKVAAIFKKLAHVG